MFEKLIKNQNNRLVGNKKLTYRQKLKQKLFKYFVLYYYGLIFFVAALFEHIF
ncbi:MAG: hypothetical protein FWF51_06505 [Chitinivibrionia bacterium]|nr:hypothetical protein [Chitinivibrionia bacterium]